MFKKSLYLVLLLNVVLFFSSCVSSNQTYSEKSNETSIIGTEIKNPDEIVSKPSSYEAYKWTPPHQFLMLL